MPPGCMLQQVRVLCLPLLQLGTDVQHHINRQFQRQWKSGLNQAEQLSPVNFLNEQTKVRLRAIFCLQQGANITAFASTRSLQ